MANRNTSKITQGMADKAKPIKGKAHRIFDSADKGLCLYVGAGGSKTWYLYYTSRDGTRQSYRIGSFENYKVEKVRKEVEKLKGDIARHKEPAAAKRKKKQAEIASKARTLNKFLEGYYWENYLSSQKSGLATKKRIQNAFEPFLDKDMASITPAALIAHRTKRLKKGVAPQTLNRDRLALHALFEKAIKPAGLIELNPTRKEEFEPLKAVDAERVRYLGERDENENFSQDERKRFMTALKTMPLNIQTLVGLAMNTGCRRGELFSLTWDRVSLKNHTITLDASTTKTSKKRTIPLNSKAQALLEAWRNKKGENISHISGLVFPSEVTGKRMDNIKRSWATLVKKAEVTDFRFHDLRHDFASRLVMAGIPLIEVRDLLGHSSITMTERYSHLAKGQLHSAVEVL